MLVIVPDFSRAWLMLTAAIRASPHSYRKPLQHPGEAQTCHLILNWASFAGSWWISDDRKALRYARHQGITTRETVDLMNIAVVNGDIAAREAFDLMQTMANSGRCRARLTSYDDNAPSALPT